jgi:hypothetical protein
MEKILNPLIKKDTENKNKIKVLNEEIDKYKNIIKNKESEINNLKSKTVKKQLLDVYSKYSNDEAQLIYELEQEKQKNELIISELLEKDKKIIEQTIIIDSKYSDNETQLIYKLEQEKQKNELIKTELLEKDKKIIVQTSIIDALRIEVQANDYMFNKTKKK